MTKQNNLPIEGVSNLPEGPKQGADSNKLGESPIGRLLASMSWPAIISMTINALYNTVDSIFVSRISQNALTAVSYVMPMQLLMIALFIGSAVGVNSLISRRLGERHYDDANQAAGTGLRIGIFNWIFFVIIGIFAAKPFMAGYTSNEEIFSSGVIYFQIITIASLFSAVDQIIEKILQSTGNMKAPMLISICGAVTNLILDPVLIFGLGPFPKLGVAGAAIATVIGQAVAMFLAIIIFFGKKHDVTIQLRGFKLNFRVLKDIYAVGLPSIIMQAIGSVLLFAFNAIISESATAVAVLGVYFKLQSFFFMPVFGLNQGAMPIMGYNYGAKKKKRLMKAFKLSAFVAFVILFIGFMIFQLMPDKLLSLFGADEEMLAMGIPALRRICICFLPASFGIMASTLFQATGHGLYSMFASLIRQLFCILPLAYILFHTFGITATWFSFPLAEIAGLTYAIVMVTHLYNKKIKHLSD